jgi:hypothetical protein
MNECPATGRCIFFVEFLFKLSTGPIKCTLESVAFVKIRVRDELLTMLVTLARLR